MFRILRGKAPCFWGFLLLSRFADLAVAQQNTNLTFIRGEGCESATTANFEKECYNVGSSRIDDPFSFLPWVKHKEQRAGAKIATLVDGQPFRYETAINRALSIINQEDFLPAAAGASVRIWLEFVSVQNCSDHMVNLVYHVYSTQVLPTLSGTPEARGIEKNAPQITAGLGRTNSLASTRLSLTPTAGYDATDKLFAGGTFQVSRQRSSRGPFDSFALQAEGSSQMRLISASLSGSAYPANWLARSGWLVNYTNSLLPTGSGSLSDGHLSAQFAGTSRAFAKGKMVARFGALLEGGSQQSAVRGELLAPDTVANAAFGALKLYGGLDSRVAHNLFSLSYGLELGSIGPTAHIDWRKHIGDVRHEFWYPLGDHHIFDIESRFTAGGIQVPGSIPLSERFFGGSYQQLFIPGDTWQIQENPVIRAIPGSRLYRTAEGAGADRFFSYNLTAAYAVWRRPLVPPEVTRDPEVNKLLKSQVTSATSIEQLHYASQDPHYATLVAQLPAVQMALTSLKSAVTAAQGGRPDQFTTLFKVCTSAINIALLRAKAAADSHDSQQYGRVSALLPIDSHENRLAKVITACSNLNIALGPDPAIATQIRTLDQGRNQLENDFTSIDQRAASDKAKADMVFVRRTLDTLFKEVNLYSISPIAIFDVADIGPKGSGVGGVRYGPGTGVRLEFATMVHFTAGYAWNMSPGPGEGSGAVFFSIGLRDLFH